ncbi:ComF family protein [Lentzea tibetensis]|uniref:ComF family protein n=1 Tax=Lentzea tibetensis TaxID=2591470 RepID=A0A563EEV2_9PSEU|nr:ComF family protein [Lentzea tibetensis]TWP43780.1 ComF family protein [Lentzea tibetensis]
MNFLSLVLPVTCAACGVRGVDACRRCQSAFGPPFPVPTVGKGPPVYALADYHGAARQLVLAFKERGRHTLADFFAVLVGLALPALSPPPWCLVPAPSTRRAARGRGGDHMVRIAERVQNSFSAPVLAVESGVQDSVGLDTQARIRNLQDKVKLRRPPPAADVVLLDDVVTSGATARACVSALSQADVRVRAVLALTSAATRHVSIGPRRGRPQG